MKKDISKLAEYIVEYVASSDILDRIDSEDPAIIERIISSATDAIILTVEASVDYLEKIRLDGDVPITAGELEEIAAVAEAFDKSGDAELQKQASVMDELLLTIATPRGVVNKIKMAYVEELNKLREKYREKSTELNYSEPKKALDNINGVKDIIDAIDKKVKTFRPLEAPLSTRYAPDYPGSQMIRISDGVYQDPITGKIYNYETGYITNKGNKVPGGSTDHRSNDFLDTQSRSMFTNRDDFLASRAALKSGTIKTAGVFNDPVGKELAEMVVNWDAILDTKTYLFDKLYQLDALEFYDYFLSFLDNEYGKAEASLAAIEEMLAETSDKKEIADLEYQFAKYSKIVQQVTHDIRKIRAYRDALIIRS